MSTLSGARTMALGTVASRGTGFLRNVVLVAVLGLKGVPLAFNIANTAPNIVYELLLGGILTSVLVPLVVRAHHEGQGEAFVQRLLTLALLVLGLTSAVLVALAPQIVALYANDNTSPDDRALAITFARYFLPQVLFYGLGAIIGALLNTQGRFGPPMWAPVLNNLVVIGTLGVFLLVPGPERLTSSTITGTQVVVLGLGVTLGIVAQTVALLPALRATGFRLRLRLDLRGTGLGPAARLAKWTLVYVVCNQAVYLVVVQLATATGDPLTYNAYVNAFLLWQLPHAVIAVSLITALLPAMSRSALDDRLGDLRGLLDQGLRMAICLLVPAAAVYLTLGRPIATALFGHFRASPGEARTVGTMLAVFACGLVAFSTYQLQLRAFYALQDTRTPALINLSVNATTVAVDLALFFTLPHHLRGYGLAAGQASSYLVGVWVCSRVLASRLPRNPEAHVLRTAARSLTAVLPPAGLALSLVFLVQALLGHGPLGA
ncbi:MAG: integral rane protein MviN, partial [Frankiales bacterium]|nr:integral rane protein MviN [Frankiales bacterium]